MTTRRTVLALMAGALACTTLAAAPAVAQEHFAGKTITFVLGVPAGSGGDLHGRLTARYMERYVPGNPTIIAANRPGGQGAIAVNFVNESGDTDGTTLFYGDWNAPAIIDELEGFNYVPEEMGAIGSAGSDLALVARRDALPDHAAIPTTELIVGGRGATNSIETLGNLGLKMLGSPFRYVGGFGGFSAIQASIKAGEIQAGHAGLPGWITFFGAEDPDVWVPYYYPNFDENGDERPKTDGAYLEDTPSIAEVYRRLHGSEPSGPYWDAFKWHQTNILSATTAILSPPGVPDNVLAILQDAFQQTVADPEYLAEYETLIGVPPPFNSTEQTERILQEFRNAPDEVKAAIAEVSGL